MEPIEYRYTDKTTWGDGPWTNEPDKLQFVTEAGLSALVVRNPGGALCGYVGVPSNHRLYGVGYDADSVYSVDVHGGLTFADSCHEPKREGWERWRAHMLEGKDEAAKHPRGDMAEAWRDRADQVDDYEKWVAWIAPRAICHVSDDGERAWWFGFDCSHSGDYSPKYDADTRGLGLSSFEHGEYRDIAYVRSQIEALAEQIAAIA